MLPSSPVETTSASPFPTSTGGAVLRAVGFVLIQILLTAMISFGMIWLLDVHKRITVITPGLVLLNDMPMVLAASISAWLVLPKGQRDWAHYRLTTFLGDHPVSRFVGGVMAGLLVCGVLAGALVLKGGMSLTFRAIDSVTLLLYVPAFLAVGWAEELTFRGPLLFWLARPLGFIPALLLTSTMFGLPHWLGGDPLWGAFSTALIGVFFGLLLRRTGSLWAPIGFHAAWDYGLSAIIGARDSGFPSKGALLTATPCGPDWLSGGMAGPEGSILCFLIIGAACGWLLLTFPRHRHRM